MSVDDIALDDDYEVTIYEPSGESEMNSVGEYTISVKLTDDGAKKYFFVGVSDSDGEDSEGGEIDSGTGAATMLYKVVKAPITVEFTDFASDEGFYNGNDWLDIIASSDSSDSGYISFKNLKSEETLSLGIDYKVTILSPDDTEAMINAGKYTVSVELIDDPRGNTAENYVLADESGEQLFDGATHEYTVKQVTMTISYTVSQQYNGKVFTVEGKGLTYNDLQIAYSPEGFEIEDTTIEVKDDISTTSADVGTYTGTLNITYDTVNFKLNGTAGYTLNIIPKVLSASNVKWDKTEFTYNGKAQQPTTATIATGVDGEGNIDLKVDVSEGSSINVGNYNATAELPDGAGNYTLEGSATHEFAIGKATLTVELTAADKDYDGTDAVIVTGEITGTLYSVGSVKDVVTVGEIVAAFDDVNAGEKKSITVKSVALEGAAANNYEADFSKSLTAKINQLGIEITWDNVESLVYNGADQAPTPKLPAGIPDGSPALTVSASVAGGHKNAGTPYNATAVLEGTAKDNYIITGGGSQPYTINKATITLEGRYSASKTYDKNVYTGSITVTSDSDSGITATADNGLSESITVNIETNDVNAKTYDNDDLSIAYSGYDSTNYKIEDKANYSVEIEKANITVSGAYSAAKTYNGEGFSGEITAATASEDFTIETSDDTFKIIVSSDEVNCGEYTKAGGKVGVEYEYDEANYNAPYDTATYTLTIEKAKITFDKSGISITETEKTYDGNVSVPEVGSGKQITIITGVKEEEVNGTYTAVYNDKGVLNATEIIITLTLQAADNYEFGKSEGNYTLKEDGSITWTISGKITPAPLTAAVTAGKTIEKTYDGNTEITVVGENLTLHDKLGADDVIIQSASGNFEDANAGDNKDITLTIVLGGDDKDNYSISAQSVKGNITKADVSVTLSGGFTYDGETHSDNDILDLGNVSATFKGATTLGLSEANLNVSGSVKDYKDGGYSVGLKDSDENITVELIGNDNYTLNAADGTITVGKAQVTSITWTVTENAGALVGDTYTATYDGKTHTITAIVHYAGGTESASVDGDDTFKDVSDSGAYEIVKSANFDFDGVTTALTVTVNKASLTFTLNPASGEYDGTEHEINIQFVTQNGETLAKDADYTIEIDGGTPGSNGLPQGVGKYTVKVTLNTESAKAKNYTVTTESQEFTVSVGKVQKPTGASIEETYNGTAHNLTVIGYVEAQMSYSIDGDGADFAIATGIFSATNAGEYTLTISLKDGYEWDDVDKSNPEFTITIDKATLTITGATVETKTYDATTTATVTDMTFEGFKGADESNVRFVGCKAEFASPDASDSATVDKISDVELTGSAADNYTVNVESLPEITGTIDKARLAIELTADKKTYDGTDTAIVTGKITGTVYSVGSVKDVVAVGDIVARFADANAGENKSITVYSVALEGAAANNYEADYEAFAENLTADIERRDITITWDNVESLVYNGENQAPTPKLPAGIPDDTPDKLSVKAIVDGDHKNAGTPYNAKAVLEGTAKDNYNIINADREFTIAKATVDVSWSGYEGLIYNGAERDITATATGVKGEEISLSVEYSAEEGSALNDNGKPQNAGNYTATADTANGNYTLGKSTKTQHFTVAKQQVNAPTIESTVYNGSPQTAHVETSVLYTAEEVVKTNAGNYDVRLTLTHPENYKWPNSEEADIVLTFTIRKADYDMSGVTFKDVTVDYDGEEHSIYIEGSLPDGVDVTYQNNGRTDVGVYTVTAIFTGDEINYNAIDNKTALLTILRVSHNLNEIGFNDVTVKYDGETHSIYIEGVLPHGVTVDYEGNGQTEPNIYTITAVFSDHIGEFERKTATLTILRLHAQSADGEVVIDSEDGFDPTLELVVEKIESVERGYWSWEKDKVSERYAVKLCKDGVEVPIDGKVTVRLLIPEAFGDKDFELKTVARAASIEYTRDGDYVVFETDGLSAYVFTRNYTPYFPIVFTATGVMLANVLVLIVLLVILKKKRETKVR